MQRSCSCSGTNERTTTIGDSELVARHNAFHPINPPAMIVAKLRACRRICDEVTKW